MTSEGQPRSLCIILLLGLVEVLSTSNSTPEQVGLTDSIVLLLYFTLAG